MKRLMELDGIRGIAALAVVCFHLAPGFAPQGWVAVDCLFVLSGYLISAILLANRGDPHYFFNFYVRRSLRIWPIYYLTLLPILAAYRLMPTNYPINSGIILQYLTYTQNIQHIWFDPADRAIQAYSHTWTLAIEEQFYMLWPLMVRTVHRRGLALLRAAIAVGSVALRGMGMTWDVLPARCDGFAMGALLALIISGHHSSAESRENLLFVLITTVVVAGAAVALFLWGPQEILTPWGKFRLLSRGEWMCGPLNLLFFGLIGVVILNVGREWLGFLRWRPLVYLGTISYGLYLYHIPVRFAVEAVFRTLGSGHSFDASRPLFRSIIELTFSITVASLSWRFIEKPVLGLKGRFHYLVEPDAVVAEGGLVQPAPSPV